MYTERGLGWVECYGWCGRVRGNENHVFMDSVTHKKSHTINMGDAHRPALLAWVSGDMPTPIFADYLEELYDGQFPADLLQVMRECDG